jgi:hypothetical protein
MVFLRLGGGRAVARVEDGTDTDGILPPLAVEAVTLT